MFDFPGTVFHFLEMYQCSDTASRDGEIGKPEVVQAYRWLNYVLSTSKVQHCDIKPRLIGSVTADKKILGAISSEQCNLESHKSGVGFQSVETKAKPSRLLKTSFPLSGRR